MGGNWVGVVFDRADAWGIFAGAGIGIEGVGEKG